MKNGIKMPPAATDGNHCKKGHTISKNNISQILPKSKVKQRDQIVRYLETHDGATVRDLVVDMNINSPTKRISELVAMGLPITKEWVHRVNSRGETKRFIVYRLRKETSDGQAAG